MKESGRDSYWIAEAEKLKKAEETKPSQIVAGKSIIIADDSSTGLCSTQTLSASLAGASTVGFGNSKLPVEYVDLVSDSEDEYENDLVDSAGSSADDEVEV